MNLDLRELKFPEQQKTLAKEFLRIGCGQVIGKSKFATGVGDI